MLDRFAGSVNNNGRPNWNVLFNMSDISENTRSHLCRVYLTLYLCVVLSIFGMYTNSAIMLSGSIL